MDFFLITFMALLLCLSFGCYVAFIKLIKMSFSVMKRQLTGSTYICLDPNVKSCSPIKFEPSVKCTVPKYDWNWDGRDFDSPSCTQSKTIYLIRHGDYRKSNKKENEKLTPLGHKQADLCGEHLSNILDTVRVSKIYHSSLIHAAETARKIHEYFPEASIESSDLLCEGFFCQAEPPYAAHKIPEQSVVQENHCRIKKAFQTYFYRASPSHKSPVTEIIVCNANVIRYFTCKLLQIPVECYGRFRLYHGSITCFKIYSVGKATCTSIGDIGFLPSKEFISY
ncbi:hypothetical protein CDAR_376381 [Caerostris darwini]|uniref:Serine/threonine-protein phosphatase PGAM5, mitochondrial n=1 Tax=Caerostris darwini TaxID=1538125 RepID=A0AAV4UZT1_9ARAC|nr:hypothetical protein CDAR_376381 [Caerostris darwini]